MVKSKKGQFALKTLLLTLAMFTVVSPVFAQGVGERLGASLTSNLNALIPAVLLCVGVYFLFTRDWMKMISFVAIAIVVAMFTNWEWVTAIAKKVYDAFIA